MDLRDIGLHISNISSVPSAIVGTDGSSFDLISLGSMSEIILTLVDSARLQPVITGNSGSVFYRYVDNTGLSILVYNDDSTPSSLVIGPFFLPGQSQEELVSILSARYGKTLSSQALRGIASSIETKALSFVESVKALLSDLTGRGNITVKEIISSEKDTPEPEAVDDIGMNRLMEDIISSSYAFEKKIRDAVTRGDRETLRKMLVPRNETELLKNKEKKAFNIIDRFASKDLRQAKNTLITLNTLFRFSIENAGVPPVYIHTISDGFAKRIENEKQLDGIVTLLDGMISAYCDVVLRLNIQSHSYRIIKVQKYIISNLTKNLSLPTLASVAGTTPQYLSRLFRSECGESITDYIRRQKISEAKLLLSSEDSPVTTIAEELGFSSINYFCSVFLEETGMTPTAYRAQCELRNTTF